ncbi:MAG: diguanylate cyclase, partial [Desulfuromonadales bacterium]|nr:diguanylate cyclase [Desulfuromonadales bacterium]
MNLKSRILLLTTALFLVSAAAAWVSVRSMAEGIVEQWAIRYAEKQVLYDKSRTLQPIMREIALSKQFVNSLYIKDFAHQPDDPQLTDLAIAEMENFRTNFRDHNYFVALLKNGKYYHNNAENEYADKQFRYVLDAKKEEDSWFFDLIEQKRDLHININPDVSLGITKLWVDILIRDGDEILGIAGTGIDLTDFLQNVVAEDSPGVTSLFIDHSGAIQLHRDQDLIDFSSISKKENEHKNISLLLDRESDRAAVLAAMKQLENLDLSVKTEFFEINGRSILAGIVYLPEIQWYEITLIDLDVLLPFLNFTGILWVYFCTILVALVLFNLVLNHLVLNPLGMLDKAMEQVGMGEDPDQRADLRGVGEIGRLMHHFDNMVQSVFESKHELEHKVKDRTAALERLTKIDPLTELLNRRGMNARIEEEISRGNRTGMPMGLLWIDIDNFK